MLESYISTHVVQITDTTDRSAEIKIRSAYVKHLGLIGLRDHTVDIVPALNTIDIGFIASELVNNNERPNRLVIAVNCAPPDKEEGTTDNARNDFICAKLGDKTFICGTNNGYEFSYLKGDIKELYRLTNTNSRHTQFRSLEILPEHTLLFSDPEKRASLIKKGVLERIENIDDVVLSVSDKTHVIEIDNFGNFKLFPSQCDLAFLKKNEGNTVTLWFDKASAEVAQRLIHVPQSQETFEAVDVLVSPTLFAKNLGTSVIALKSSSRFSHSLSKNRDVPIIATIRDRPAETKPRYIVPKVGTFVNLEQSHCRQKPFTLLKKHNCC